MVILIFLSVGQGGYYRESKWWRRELVLFFFFFKHGFSGQFYLQLCAELFKGGSFLGSTQVPSLLLISIEFEASSFT